MTAPIKDFVAMFIPLGIAAFGDELGAKGTGIDVPAFTHEGFTGEAHHVSEIMPGHGFVTIEPGRKAERFPTREEAEAFIAAQTIRQSGWIVVPRT
jgi:hypothetical protein